MSNYEVAKLLPWWHRRAEDNSGLALDYKWYQEQNNQLRGHVKVRVALDVATQLSQKCPYPTGVKLGIMKQISNSQEITLQQMRILFGWAADKAMR